MILPENFIQTINKIRNHKDLKHLPDEAFSISFLKPKKKQLNAFQVKLKNFQNYGNSFTIKIIGPVFYFEWWKSLTPQINSDKSADKQYCYSKLEPKLLENLEDLLSVILSSSANFIKGNILSWNSFKPTTTKKETFISKFLTNNFLENLSAFFKDIPEQALTFNSYENDEESCVSILSSKPCQELLLSKPFYFGNFSIVLLKPKNNKPQLFLFLNEKQIHCKSIKDFESQLYPFLKNEMTLWRINWISEVNKKELLDILPLSLPILKDIPKENFVFEQDITNKTISTKITLIDPVSRRREFVLSYLKEKNKTEYKFLYDLYDLPFATPFFPVYKNEIVKTSAKAIKEKLYELFSASPVFNKELLLDTFLDINKGNNIFSGMPIESFSIRSIHNVYHIFLIPSNQQFYITIDLKEHYYKLQKIDDVILIESNNLPMFKKTLNNWATDNISLFVDWIKIWAAKE